MKYNLQNKKKIKMCRKCGIVLTKNTWWTSRRNAGDYICDYCYKKQQKVWYNKNKEKIKKQNRTWYRNNRDKFEDKRLRYEFGITLKNYNYIAIKQSGVCAICHRENTGGNQYGISKLNVDHNHKTGKVRGLLCSKCNLALGGFDTDDFGTRLLIEAIKYIDRSDCD